ncbi:MAG: T9SS type A sorting domain-containing protein, partial [Cyclobacteriaceae bacterium]
ITQPEFELIDDDYLDLSQSKFRDLKPYFADVNNDGKSDLLLAATGTDLTHRLYFLPNQSSGLGQTFDVLSPNEVALVIAENDNPFFYDVDKDGFVDLLLGKVTGGLEYRRNTGNTTDPTFVLETDAFAGLANNTGKRNLVPLMDDINNDGVADLLVTDDTGILRLHTDILGQTEPQIISQLIGNSLTGQQMTSRLGRRNWMATGKLFGNNLPTLLVGSIPGGLLFFDNLSEDGNFNGGSQETFIVEVFPNPGPPFKIRSNHTYSYFLYSTLGQLISAEGPIPANQTRTIDSRNLRGGMYVLRAVSAAGSSTSKKIIVAPR